MTVNTSVWDIPSLAAILPDEALKWFERNGTYSQCTSAYDKGELSAREAAKRCGVVHKTFLRWVSWDKENQEKWRLSKNKKKWDIR